MPLEKRHKFLLKRNLAVMFLLIGDVFFHLSQTGMAHAERTVTDLPCKCFLIWKFFMYPARRIGFQFAHQIRQRVFGRERGENVEVVRRAIDDDRLAVVGADDAAEIGKEARFQIRVEHWSPVFRAENNVRQQMGERVRHKSKLRNRLVCFSHGVASDSSPR